MITYTADTEEMRKCLGDVFDRVVNGDIKVEINQRYALADVRQAHEDLQARRTTGSSILVP